MNPRLLKIALVKAVISGDITAAKKLETEIEENTTVYAHELTGGGFAECEPGQGIGIKGALLNQLDKENIS